MRSEEEVREMLARAQASEALGSRPDSRTVLDTLEWVLEEDDDEPLTPATSADG
jgi:hypothetical protein